MTDLNNIALFVDMAETGSISAAARKRHMPKATLSRRLAQLEAGLGLRLFERTTRTLRLTDVGQTFYARNRPLIRALEEAEAMASQARETVEGVLRIAAPVEFALCFLEPAITQFRALHPGLQFELILTPTWLDLVAEGIDLAFRVGPQPDSSLIARRLPLANHGRTLYASPTYLQKNGTPKTLDDLARHACLTFTEQGPARWTFTTPAGPRVLEVSGPLKANNITFLRDMALAHHGIALLPDFLCGCAHRGGELVKLLCDTPGAPLDIFAVYPSSRYLPAKTTRFLSYATDMWQV